MLACSQGRKRISLSYILPTVLYNILHGVSAVNFGNDPTNTYPRSADIHYPQRLFGVQAKSKHDLAVKNQVSTLSLPEVQKLGSAHPCQSPQPRTLPRISTPSRFFSAWLALINWPVRNYTLTSCPHEARSMEPVVTDRTSVVC